MPPPSLAGPAIDWPRALAENAGWMRTVVAARLRNRTAVDEVLQEIALAVVRRPPPHLPVEKVGPWLYRLAVLQALLYRRRQGRRERLVQRYADRAPPSGEERPDPLEWLLAGERQRAVREALTRLPPRDAELLLLKYIEDWNYHQIARHLGISHSAVEARLHRARRRMRDELAALQVIETTR